MIDFMKVIGAVVFAFTAILWRGFVLTKLWGWFIPAAFGLAPISLRTATGIFVILNALLTRYTVYKDHETDTLPMNISTILGPATMLWFGYLFHLYL